MNVRKVIKRFLVGVIAVLGVCIIALVVLLAIILSDSKCSEEELARYVSPSGAYEALVIEKNCGATMSYIYDIAIGKVGDVKSRQVLAWFSRYHSTEHYDGLHVLWVGDSKVVVCYLKAENAIIVKKSVDILNNRIEVILKPGVEDPSKVAPEQAQ